MQVVHQVHQFIGPLFILFGTTQDKNRVSIFWRYYENVKEFLTVFDLYIPKQGSDDSGCDGSDDMSDINSEINAMD